jgi:hypothetical protein
MKRSIIPVALLATLLSFSLAWSDTTIETTHKTSGFRGIAASKGTTIQRYQAYKLWESTTTGFAGAILSKITGKQETITITRVDKGVYWTLDSEEMIYEEDPIVPLKDMTGKKPSDKKAEGKSKVQVRKSQFTVKETGASETINGFPCKEYLITWLLEMEDVETKQRSLSTMTTNLWSTPETATVRSAQADVMKFQRAFARKLGVNVTPDEARLMGMEVFVAMSGMSEAELSKGLSRVQKKMSKIKGYPIRTEVTWNLEPAGDASVKEGPGASTSTQDTAGRSCLFGGLAGLTGQQGPSGSAPLFSSEFEVKSIEVKPVPAKTFEIPTGYTKK